MPAHPFKTNFSAGEISPKLGGRVDLSKVANGAASLHNFSVMVQGGVARRAGTQYVATAKASGAFQDDAFQADAFDVDTGQTQLRLVPFQFSVTQAYMCEFGAGYIRFYADRAPVLDGSGTPVEVVTPYTGAELRQLRFAQSADVLYIAHQSHPPQKLSRVTTTSFLLSEIVFLPPPLAEVGVSLDAALTLSATTGTAVTGTTTNPVFLAADVARQIKAGTGRGVITAVGTASSVTLAVLDPFASVGPFALNGWTLEDSPAADCTPSAKEPLHKIITLTLSLAGWRSEDVGKYVTIHSGVVRITAFTSDTVVSGEILKVLTAVTAAPAGAWTLEQPAWSAAQGYPGTVALQGQRLLWGGSLAQPDTVWGSVVGDYENHGTGADDDDAIVFTIAQSQVNVIRWMKGLKALMVGTVGGELRVHGASDGPLTPSSIQVDDETVWGVDFNVDAIRVSNVILFLQRGAKIIRELAFAFDSGETGAYVAPNLTLLGEHLVRDGIVEMAYLPQPDSALLALRSDGTLLAMTYERPEQVVAWSHHVTRGQYVSVATMPNACGTGDEVWVAVQRVAANDERFIEVFDGLLTVDAGLVYEDTPTTEVAGLDHLEGLTTAAVWRDWAFQTDTFQADLVQPVQMGFESGVVTGGIFTLSAARSNVQIGLPYSAHVLLLKPELGLPSGSLQGRRQRYVAVSPRVYCAFGTITVGGEVVPYPEGAGGGVRAFTGDLPGPSIGWSRGQQVRIEAPDPLPCSILGVAGSIEADNG